MKSKWNCTTKFNKKTRNVNQKLELNW